MRRLLTAALATRSTVVAACAASLALGLFFIFAWSPLPWGWQGIDFYEQIAKSVARGEPFPTMHLVWGYVWFLSIWYRLFGDRPWIPLTVQAICNAAVPYLLYRLVRLELGERIAIASALLAGILSFNTIYASTQASDAMCTVLFLAAMLAFTEARIGQRLPWMAVAGVLVGVAYQFRPNFVLFPFFAGALYLASPPHNRRKLAQVAVFAASFALVAAPWIVRNYRWSGLFVPASTHGGVQLWFGSLQVGPYQESWTYNPRAAFENAPVDYSSVDELPLIVSAQLPPCARGSPVIADIVYRTNRDSEPLRVRASIDSDGNLIATLPRPDGATSYKYYVEMTSGSARAYTPPEGWTAPLLFVASRDHLGDLDLGGDALDIFDLGRMLRQAAWHEPLPADRRPDLYDLDADGAVTESDVRRGFGLLADVERRPEDAVDVVARIDVAQDAVRVTFRDRSTLNVPRIWQGIITDIDVRGPTAQTVVSAGRTFGSLHAHPIAAAPRDGRCLAVENLAINRVPYRRQPHEMRRFTALALDNIRRDPAAYLAASARRAARLFIIEGSGDRRTANQFPGSAFVYAAGRIVSMAYLALLVAGVAIAIRRRLPLFTYLLPIAYVPLTICFMLINARYATTIQPFLFVFIAIVIVELLDALERRSNHAMAGGRMTMASGRK